MGAMEVDRNGLEVLDEETCRQLLSRAVLGRVATTVGALPTIVPVNFKYVDGYVVFRTSPGAKFEAALNNAVVAFEVDHMDAFSHSGWSVLAIGVASLVTDPDEIERYAKENIPRWAPSGEEHYARISTELLSGRRINPALVARNSLTVR